MKARHQIESHHTTPEQLLQLLDLQLAQERGKREGRSRNRATILVLGLLAIAAAAGVALVIAQQMLADLRERGAGLNQTGGQSGFVENL